MDDREFEAYVEKVMEEVLAALAVIAHFLRWHLPLPVEVPTPEDENWTGQEALPALDRARKVLKDLVPNPVLQDIDSMILEAVTALEVAALGTVAGWAPWRFEIILKALGRSADLYQTIDPYFPCSDPDREH